MNPPPAPKAKDDDKPQGGNNDASAATNSTSPNLVPPDYGNWFPSGERVGELGKSYQTWVGEKVIKPSMDAAYGLSNTASDAYGAGTRWFEGVGRGFSGQSDTTPTYSTEGLSGLSDIQSFQPIADPAPWRITQTRTDQNFVIPGPPNLHGGSSTRKRTRGRKKNVSKSKSFKKHLHSKKKNKKMGSKNKQTKVNIR